MDNDSSVKNSTENESITNASSEEISNDTEYDSVSEELDDDIPDEIKEILNNVSEPAKKKIKQVMIQSSMAMGIMGHKNQESAIAKKLTSEHINEYLSASRENMVKGFQERRENKIYIFALVLVALIFFVVLILLLKSNPNLLEKIVYSVVGLVAGAFGGYGVGRHKRNQDEDD